MKENIIKDKSFAFAVRIIKLYQYLYNGKKELVLSKQLLRSGTSIGANIREALHGQSKNDFLSKINIALKEADESLYWIDLFAATNIITKEQQDSIGFDCKEIVSILHSIVKTTKSRVGK